MSLSAIATHCSDMIHCSAPPRCICAKPLLEYFPCCHRSPKLQFQKLAFLWWVISLGFGAVFLFSNGGLVGVSNGHKALTHVCRWTVIVQQSVHIIHFYILIILYIMLYASHSSAVIISQARDLVCKGAKANMSAVSMYKALALDLL